jgi:Spy/CpxP family protein refolding chaperone
MNVAAPRTPTEARRRAPTTPWARGAVPAAVLAAVLAAGCASTPPPPPATPPPPPPALGTPPTSDKVELPPSLQGLDLTPAQQEEIFRIGAELEREGATVVSAAMDFGHSVAGAARQCKGETPFVEADAARVVRVSEEMREPVVTAVQRLHRLLTPEQRKKLSVRLLEGNDAARRERRNESRTRSLGPQLDLTTMQMVTMLVKARALWGQYADRAEPWRLHYETAAEHFARADFDAHSEPLARVPIVAFTMDFVRTGLRFLIPILEPQQCEALGRVIDDTLDKQAERAALRARAAEARDARKP